jgi:hypothetical protein
MAVTREQIRVGMEVVGSDGRRIGTVKEVRTSDFLVNRPMARDIYVPFGAIQTISGNTVTLTIPADQVEQMGWAHPPVFGG